ncbi:F0F1 ATP synthase subunit A [Persicimonas caeni]|jgi:F-type H+-transporting ATPase subunit a|uniref:ATP synthase subunit a n=1 Tax=Persicimonas caeni TaxID=2292766 RepID=A0A4Y6PQ68_PERCE|nr:F0F1 ATP synthase subunit A [Persicimonas caeni]QDG50420.1 F0F1 ATP synthase subunit A [Persicimonas caeni]QED31641.1 F0F1 ATP synthase subunit A [Persicimonas caeni]
MELTPDSIVYARWGFFELNATIVFGWVVSAILVVGSWLITRNLSRGAEIPRWQNLLEVLVDQIRTQLAEITRGSGTRYLPFVGTLFLFIGMSNLLLIVPFYQAPTASLSTTTALALCVFVAVPFYGIVQRGLWGYLKSYAQPSIFMLPFNIIGDFSRTVALAVRLFGNIMSGTLIAAILLALAPLFFPVLMNALGLLTGMIQAYIFAVLAAVYIASATQAQPSAEGPQGTTHD